MIKNLVSAAILAVGLAVPGAQAAVYTVDLSVETEIEYSPIGRQCRIRDCSISVESLAPDTIDATPGGSVELDDLFSFTGTNPGFLQYTITAILNIGNETVTGIGSGIARFNAFGALQMHALSWESVDSTTASIDVDFENSLTFIRQKTVSTGATVDFGDAVYDTPAAVPLPASAASLLLGVAAFAGYRRMQKRRR